MRLLDYNSDTMQSWRKEVQDYLGFALRVPEYSRVASSFKEHLAPMWDYCYIFYDDQNRPICGLNHHDDFFPCDRALHQIPGVPETFGSDEDWSRLFDNYRLSPPFKGFPWNFMLTFFDEKARIDKEIHAKRTFRNDSRPTIHMAWYLTQYTYDASGNSDCSRSCKYFDWELPL